MVHRPMAKEKTMRSSHKGQALMGKKADRLRSTLEIWGERRSAAACKSRLLKEAKAIFNHYAGSRHTKPVRSYQSGFLQLTVLADLALRQKGLGSPLLF